MARKNWLLGAGAIAVIAVPLGLGLKQDLEKEPTARTEAPAAPAATPVAVEPPPAPPATSHMPPDFFRDVLGTGKPAPALVGPLFRVQWGVPRAELPRLAPELFSWHHPQVTINPLVDEDRLVAGVRVEFPDDGAAVTAMRGAWGAPDEQAGGSSTWRSGDETFRVTLWPATPDPDKARVVVSPAAR